ncbi:rhomboid family intramembrane serine protease [Salidesulfovibrio onnuriiensis]|uniref:rhomboid family intramembrane serine protease n=1 Tax=Salidesulfovibrio onnuriiensis TaxID=2583823 RepID=UPI0011CCA8A2|nr:rhomboid family intramembrane serine protease [Salidesulfovibrio onnuriiensis]
MIPLRDNVPRVTLPITVSVIIMLNAFAFGFELLMDPRSKVELFHLFGVVPQRFLDSDWAHWVGYPEASIIPFFTYMFLHSGWLHVILNMWMLWIFGDNIEDVTGHFGFVFFYVACGLAAVGAHMLAETGSSVPVIGASGAVAGVMGAYLVLYPHGKVYTLFPILIIPIILRVPSVFFLGFWFLSQFFAGIFSVVNGSAQPVAWWAHVGGFVTGILLISLFRGRGRCKYCYNRRSKNYDIPVEDKLR